MTAVTCSEASAPAGSPRAMVADVSTGIASDGASLAKSAINSSVVRGSTVQAETGGVTGPICVGASWARTPVWSIPMREDFGGVFAIDWDGLDSQRRPAPPGDYAIRLKGLLEAESIEKLNYVAHFFHHARAAQS